MEMMLEIPWMSRPEKSIGELGTQIKMWDIPQFSGLPQEVLHEIMREVIYITVPPYTVLHHPEDAASCFYVLLDGTFTAWRRPHIRTSQQLLAEEVAKRSDIHRYQAEMELKRVLARHDLKPEDLQPSLWVNIDIAFKRLAKNLRSAQEAMPAFTGDSHKSDRLGSMVRSLKLVQTSIYQWHTLARVLLAIIYTILSPP